MSVARTSKAAALEWRLGFRTNGDLRLDQPEDGANVHRKGKQAADDGERF